MIIVECAALVSAEKHTTSLLGVEACTQSTGALLDDDPYLNNARARLGRNQPIFLTIIITAYEEPTVKQPYMLHFT